MKRLLLHPLGISVVAALAGTAAAFAIQAFDAPRWLYLPLALAAFAGGVAHSRWERRQVPVPEPHRSRVRYCDDGTVRRPVEEV